MAFASIKTTQNDFLVNYLRGTGRELSAAQAHTLYGIKNIRARATELRQAGLVVRTRKNSRGRTSYAISARDVTGSRAQVAV
jgi:hypothetical protein